MVEVFLDLGLSHNQLVLLGVVLPIPFPFISYIQLFRVVIGLGVHLGNFYRAFHHVDKYILWRHQDQFSIYSLTCIGQ